MNNIIKSLRKPYISDLFYNTNALNKNRNSEYTLSVYNKIIVFSKGVYMNSISKINSDDYDLIAILPIKINYKIKDSILISESPELGISSFGDDCKDAQENLLEKILFIWQEYVECSDDKLTKESQILKSNMIRHFRKQINGD